MLLTKDAAVIQYLDDIIARGYGFSALNPSAMHNIHAREQQPKERLSDHANRHMAAGQDEPDRAAEPAVIAWIFVVVPPRA